MNSKWTMLFSAVLLLAACRSNDGDCQYQNYRFKDSTLEKQVAEVVEAMDVPDSVLLAIEDHFVDGWDTFYSLPVIGTYHPEYHYEVDNRTYAERTVGVVEIAGHRCMIIDSGFIDSDYLEKTAGRTAIEIRASLPDNDESIHEEEVHYLFLDSLGHVAKDSAAINSNSAMFFDVCYRVVENDPEFPGGQDSLRAFMERNLRNPRQVEGKVYVRFIVERNGRMKNLEVIHGIDEETDEEVLRVMRLMPRWIPGRQRDKLARVWVYYPVKISPTEQ